MIIKELKVSLLNMFSLRVYQMASPPLLYSLHVLLEQDSELQLSCIFLWIWGWISNKVLHKHSPSTGMRGVLINISIPDVLTYAPVRVTVTIRITACSLSICWLAWHQSQPFLTVHKCIYIQLLVAPLIWHVRVRTSSVSWWSWTKKH